MKKRNILSFCTGFLAAALLFGGVTSALAASDTVFFSGVNLSVNGNTIFSRGEEIETASGDRYPSSLIYTNEAGGGTTYLPLAYLSDLLNVPISWDGASGTVFLGRVYSDSGTPTVTEGEPDVRSLPLDRVGQSVFPFTEVAPAAAGETAAVALDKTTYVSTSDFVRQISAPPTRGRYISVTITNNGEVPLLFQLGRQYAIGEEMLSTHVPVGETVTRTLEIAETDSLVTPKLAVRVSYYGALPQDIDITISASQFN